MKMEGAGVIPKGFQLEGSFDCCLHRENRNHFADRQSLRLVERGLLCLCIPCLPASSTGREAANRTE